MEFATGEIARCHAKYMLPNGVEAINRYTAQWTGATPRSYVDSITDWTAYLTSIFNFIHPHMSSNVTMGGAVLSKAFIVAGKEVLEFAGLVPMTPGATGAGDMLPHGVAALVSTDLDGQGRGSAKKFYPGMLEANQTDGVWNAAFQTILGDVANAWAGDFGPGLEWNSCSWSVLKGVRQFVLPVARPFPAYQRRRKPGVGT